MRSKIIALVILGTLAACNVQDKGDDDDKGGSGGNGGASGQGGAGGNGAGGAGGGGPSGGGGSSGGGGGGATPGAKGWTVMPLLDDERDPERTYFRAGNDMVTGIFFASLDEGFVTTTGENQTSQNGGVIYRAKQKQITDIAFGGPGLSKCLGIGEISYLGIQKTSKGYVARSADVCDFVSSDDGGKTFSVGPPGVGDPFGSEANLAYRETATGAVVVRNTGVISVTTGAPGPNAIWDDIWAPGGVPPTPNPVPDDQCQAGPYSQFNPKISDIIYVSPDGTFMAYGASPADDPQVCVSTDGGKSFFPKILPGVSEDVLFAPPVGVTFANAQVGIAWYAFNIYPDATYIYRTTDGGNTWAKAALPPELAGKGVELNGGFFAPDGQHGWIVGYNYDNGIGLVLKTSDAGATWTSASGDLAAKVEAAGGGKLRSGFALDEYHLWVGGERGVLLANEAGGE